MRARPERLSAHYRLILAVGFLLPASQAAGQAAGKPNIIFIFTDDQAPRTHGFEGNKCIRTPNIDRLARQGTVFSRAYIPLPQCAPSRAAVLLGLYPHDTGVLSNYGAMLDPNRLTFAKVLKQRGYRCGMVGKWHLGFSDRPQGGFEDYWVALDLSVPEERRYHDPQLWVGSKSAVHKGYLTDILTDYAIKFVDGSGDQPFMLWLAYKAPHVPLTRPPDGRFAYNPNDIPLPLSVQDDLSTKPKPQQTSICHEWFVKADPQTLREEIALYYSMISAVDYNIGRLMDHLKERGLDDNTLIIYMSDNGVLMGEHQMVRKGPALYEELVRMPMIFWWPGVVPAGQHSTALVSSLDLFPTMTALAGTPRIKGLAGQNIWPVVMGEVDAVRDALFFEYQEKGSEYRADGSSDRRMPMLGVVTDRYKYVCYLKGGEQELYDLKTGPYEMNNLINSPEHAAVARELSSRVGAFAKTIKNPFWQPPKQTSGH